MGCGVGWFARAVAVFAVQHESLSSCRACCTVSSQVGSQQNEQHDLLFSLTTDCLFRVQGCKVWLDDEWASECRIKARPAYGGKEQDARTGEKRGQRCSAGSSRSLRRPCPTNRASQRSR